MEDVKMLFEKYTRGSITKEELHRLFDYLREHAPEGELEELVTSEIKNDDVPDELPEHLEEIFNRNQAILRTRMKGATDKKVIRINKWLVAAGIIFLLSACFLLYRLLSNNNPTVQDTPQTAQADILPATDRATLTLADGRTINLDEAATGTLAKESSINISKSAAGELIYQAENANTEKPYVTYNTLKTPNGGRYKIALPDGTLVWLNAGSSLTYPVQFAKNERRVKLSGEAYFEVAKKGGDHPFIVESKGQEVRVLGTHFNVNTYDNEPSMRTTLVEGKVAVTSGEATKILKPGEQSKVSGTRFSVTKVDTEEFTAWKDNLFIFHSTDIVGILRQVERWYDVTFDYKQLPKEVKMYGELPRDIGLSGLLTVLEKNTGLKFTAKGRRIMIAQ